MNTSCVLNLQLLFQSCLADDIADSALLLLERLVLADAETCCSIKGSDFQCGTLLALVQAFAACDLQKRARGSKSLKGLHHEKSFELHGQSISTRLQCEPLVDTISAF